MYFLASETSQCFLVNLLSHDFTVLSALPTSVTLMLYSACKITVLKKKAPRLSCTSFSGSIIIGSMHFIRNHSIVI